MKMQQLISLDSKPGNVKQISYVAWMNVWKQGFSSKQLDSLQNSNCHVKVQGSIAAILQESSHFCFNRSSTMPVEDEYTKNNAKAMQQLIKRS
jgi:hypothetical protein